MNQLPIENRGPQGSGGPFALLATRTGLSETFLAELAERGELRAVIDELGERRSDTSGRLRLMEIQRKRWPRAPMNARVALMELMAKRWPSWEFDDDY